MKNPFSSDVPEEKKLVRNVFDLGRSSVFTTEFGQLYPFFLQEVVPGDSVQLDAQVGLRGMPTLFPLQTKMRCSIEFYYVRNRTLYKDWEDFIYKTKDVEAPWLKLNNERAKQMISTGSLGDALGVPSSYASDSSLVGSVPFIPAGDNHLISSLFISGNGYQRSEFTFSYVLSNFVRVANEGLNILQTNAPDYAYSNFVNIGYFSGKLDVPLTDTLRTSSFLSTISEIPRSSKTYCCLLTRGQAENYFTFGSLPFECEIIVRDDGDLKYLEFSLSELDKASLIAASERIVSENKEYVFFYGTYDSEPYGSTGYYTPSFSQPYFPLVPDSNSLFGSDFVYSFLASGVVDSTDERVIDSNPFVGSNPDIKISALPFRAYEQVMNYYYRNDKNNPYVIGNEVQYNEFIPTHVGGADENVYDFHYRNWELDRFTSAVPSPQFGEAPLVGLTYNPSKGTATLKLEGASVTDAEGVVTQTDPEIIVGVDTDGKLDSIIDFSKDVPSANLRKLQEQMQSNTGISINDLRVTNSFQRFLENTLRRGLRYRNQLKSHHHVSVDYPDIDVPQYLGGASGIVDTGQVTNMSQTGNVGLGDYIGTLAGGVSLKHKIQQYCVEHGWIIGIVSVCPLPCYPQSINKSLIKTNPFDYFLPEFGKIGYVPIHYSELMPLQTGPGQSVDDIFAYQKANYDYMQAFDEVHGDFRISLKDFVLGRTFAERPQLSESFTVIDPEQLNDVFLANNIATPYGSTARWMCRSNVSCIMKRQIPIIGTPSLE